MKKRWKNYEKNPCQGACQGKGYILKNDVKIPCPDCDGTQVGLLEPPDESSKYVVTSR
jgi:hypothetical protein